MRLIRPLSIAAVGVLTVGVAATFAAPSSGFSDVPSSHPDAQGVDYLQEKGVVEGFGDGSYRPDQGITRAEFTKIIVSTIYTSQEIDELLSRTSLTQMPDVPSDAWYARFVDFARASGIVKGYPDGTFQPLVAINAAEAAKIIAETFDLPMEDGSVWYEGYVRALADAHAIPTSIDRLSSLLTRGEMAEIAFRLQTGTTDKPSLTYEDLNQATNVTNNNGCVRYGCHKELCVDETETYTGAPWACDEGVRYACYDNAVCERQSSGACGWTSTPELSECLRVNQNELYPVQNPQPTDPCAAVQCHINYRCENGECILKQLGEKCGIYYRQGDAQQYCATCGNNVCEPMEHCTSSSCTNNGCTNNCGPLYCPTDCDIVE